MLPPDQQDLQDAARRFLTTRDPPASSATFGDWPRFAELGWLGVAVDEAHGGFGGPAQMSILAQELAVVGAPEPFLQAAVVPVVFLAHAPRSPATETRLAALVNGEHATVAAFDAPGVSTVQFTTAGGRIHIVGRCSHVLGGSGARSILFTAQHAEHADVRSIFLLDTDTPGIQHQCAPTIDGRIASVFDLHVDLGADADIRLGSAQALLALELAQDAGLLGQCAEMIGLMQHLFTLTRSYLLERRQFGQPLAEFQALRHRLADMYAELEQSRAMLGYGVRAMDLPHPAARSRLLSGCKIRIARAARFIGAQAIQLHGAIALTQEYAVGRAYQRLLVLEKTWGDIDFHVRRFHAMTGDAND